MRKNELRRLLATSGKCLNGWIAVPNSFQAEVYAAQGFDSVTIDMQHGACQMSDMIALLQAVSLSGVTPMVRIPWNEPSHIQRVLDMGAYGIICPMINTRAEAEALVASGRYPPLGARSNGPFRATQYAGVDYQPNANEEILLFAMIETRDAVSNLDEILAVPGLDGTYVGPTDLALSYGKPATLDPTDPEILELMRMIADKTLRAGKIPGSHTDSAKTALKRFEDGYRFCTLLNDVRVLAAAVGNMVREARGLAKVEGPKSY